MEFVDFMHQIAMPKDVISRLNGRDTHCRLVQIQMRMQLISGLKLAVSRLGTGEGSSDIVKCFVEDKKGSEHEVSGDELDVGNESEGALAGFCRGEG